MAKTLYLFSSVQGVVLDKGKPVPGAEVERIYNWGWKDLTGQEKIVTGPDGSFHFDPVVESSFWASILPHEPVVTQKILIRHGGVEYKAWMFTRHNYEENGELNGKPVRLTCDLGSEPSAKGDIFGICAIE